MQKKRNKKRNQRPRASIRQRRKRRPSPVSVTSSFDEDHDPDRCASCQWRAESDPDAMIWHGGELRRIGVSTIPRVRVRVVGRGLAALCEGIELYVPEHAELGTVLEVVFLSNPHLEVPELAIDLRVNGTPRAGNYRVTAGDEISFGPSPT